jgi:hypothetical protein
MASINCEVCKDTVEYKDDGITFDCMPDGVMVDSKKWVCGDCIVDENGETKPEYR